MGGIGFRDSRLFNQALLARQGWRLLQKPNSVCARLMKAKYYTNGNLLDTIFVKNASASWKGVEHGLELLKKGTIWRVGNGSKIRIWRDNWISRDGLLKVTGKKKNSRLKRVRSLFGDGINGWNNQLVNDIFLPHDAEQTLKIKVPNHDMEDTIA
jgi:hypothetical protein